MIKASSLSLTTENKVNILKYIETQVVMGNIQPNSQNINIENFLLFMNSVNIEKFIDKKSTTQFKSFKDIYNTNRYSDLNFWDCHISAPHFVDNETGFDCVFGFATHTLLSKKEHIFLHSFGVKNNIIYDPQVDYLHKREKEFVKQNIISKKRITEESVHSYFGVRIPKNIISDITNPKEEKIQKHNLWGFMKYQIFYDKQKTKEFIDVVNDSGKNWKYDYQKTKVAYY